MVGTGLLGLLATRTGASKVVISDFPDDAVLSSIKLNVGKNIPERLGRNVSVQAHEWGCVQDEFSTVHAAHFTRILCADCLWMAGEHPSLVKSMLHFLANILEAQVWITAGFHTGRPTIAHFFSVAAGADLRVERIWEKNVHGEEREWAEERDEDSLERQKWTVVAILRRNI